MASERRRSRQRQAFLAGVRESHAGIVGEPRPQRGDARERVAADRFKG
nr:hypothetical protein [Burkholderia cepacia]